MQQSNAGSDRKKRSSSDSQDYDSPWGSSQLSNLGDSQMGGGTTTDGDSMVTPVDHVQASLQANMFSAEAQAELEGTGDEEDFSFAEASITSSITRGTTDRTLESVHDQHEVASPPIPENEPSVEKGEVYHDPDEPVERFFDDHRRRRLAILGVLLLAIAGALIATGVVLATKNTQAANIERAQTSSPTVSQSPSLAPSLAASLPPSSHPSLMPTSTREALINEAIRTIYGSLSSKAAFEKGTKQYEARRWVVFDDPKVISHNDHVPLKQRYALAVFYFSTGGPQWTSKGDWMAVTHECGEVNNNTVYDAWYGIGCNENNQVRAIAFDGNNLSGEIPPEISLLVGLENLILKNDRNLGGEIPESLGDISGMRQLGLYGNKLTGAIPSRLFDMIDLFYLNLSDNKLEGYLDQKVGKLTKLRKLILDKNSIKGSINVMQLRHLPLTFLSLANNKFSGNVTDPLRFMAQLEFLYLNDNEFVGSLPPKMGLMSKLQSLAIDRNNFDTTIPTEFGQLKELSFFTASEAGIKGDLPSEIGNMSALKTLNLAGNKITEIPNTIANLAKLKYIYFYQTDLKGPLPEGLFDLSIPEVLFLSSNNHSGELSPNIAKVKNTLKQLYLSDNNFSGNLTASICELENLEVLFLDSNKFTGQFPDCIGNLSNLKQLYVFGNKFEGNVPESLASLEKLEYLGLEENSFSGVIPASVCALRDTSDGKLKELWADCNTETLTCKDGCCTQCCPDEGC